MDGGSSRYQNSFHRTGKDLYRKTDRPNRRNEMNADQILNEIREANLSYLMLAQSLIRTRPRAGALPPGHQRGKRGPDRLLTPAQMMKIAAGNTLLCRFRMDDDMVWGLLTNHGKSAANDTTAACTPRSCWPAATKKRPDHATQQEHPHRSQADRARRRADQARRAPAGAGVGNRPLATSACCACTRKSRASRRARASCRSRPTGS